MIYFGSLKNLRFVAVDKAARRRLRRRCRQAGLQERKFPLAESEIN
jgi:hypothetical protein